MTRFARASGSKASNERQPEEATSWQEMRKQMEQRKHQIEANEAGLRAFEQRNNISQNNTSPKKNSWAEFDVTDNSKPKKKDNKTNKPSDDSSNSNLQSKQKSTNKVNPTLSTVIEKKLNKKPKKSTKELKSTNNLELPLSNENETLEVDGRNEKKKKKKTSFKNIKNDMEANKESVDNMSPKLSPVAKKKLKKLKIKQTNGLKSTQDNTTMEENNSDKQIEITNDSKYNQLKKNKINKNGIEKDTKHSEKFEKQMRPKQTFPNKKPGKFTKGNNKLGGKRKAELNNDSRPWKRRKIEPAETIMFINGEKITVVKYDGFQVQKKDAEALTDLKNKLQKDGVNEEEIKQTMKIARRRAEKSLARVRKSVCFHCRKSGHLLSDCPEILTSEERPVSGVCYKCGSTEHSYLQCKVAKNSGFRFAECFICKEQGHIARECPDNPKGLYPKGGACKLCGDVTHFKKDCPKSLEDKQNNKITLSLLDENVETLGNSVHSNKDSKTKTISKKVIKF